MVMIEHFSKWLKVVAIPSKKFSETVRVFCPYLVCRYGVPAKVLTKQGTKFRVKFQEMLDETLIDHCRTLQDHPHADGLAERMV